MFIQNIEFFFQTWRGNLNLIRKLGFKIEIQFSFYIGEFKHEIKSSLAA